MGEHWNPWTRRDALKAAGAVTLAGWALSPAAALATPDEAKAVLDRLTGGASMKEGRITVKLPAIAEDGSSVPITVTVASPMSEADHVKAIHIVSEENPNAEVASFHFSPRSGKAEVATRIRLAKTQTVLAVAVMNDGSIYIARTPVTVTVGGCGN